MSLAPPQFAHSSLAGYDVSWIAVDTDGHVAWFVTFGSAVVPQWIEERTELYDSMEAVFAAMPERGECSTDQDAATAQWRAFARRGVFTLRLGCLRRPVQARRGTAPTLEGGGTPPELRELARRTRFADSCFASRARGGRHLVRAPRPIGRMTSTHRAATRGLFGHYEFLSDDRVISPTYERL